MRVTNKYSSYSVNTNMERKTVVKIRHTPEYYIFCEFDPHWVFWLMMPTLLMNSRSNILTYVICIGANIDGDGVSGKKPDNPFDTAQDANWTVTAGSTGTTIGHTSLFTLVISSHNLKSDHFIPNSLPWAPMHPLRRMQTQWCGMLPDSRSARLDQEVPEHPLLAQCFFFVHDFFHHRFISFHDSWHKFHQFLLNLKQVCITWLSFKYNTVP